MEIVTTAEAEAGGEESERQRWSAAQARRERARRRRRRREKKRKSSKPSVIDPDDPPEPTDEEIAKNWKFPPTLSDKCVGVMMVTLSAFYDFSAAIISVVDVTTDALVTYEFYRDDKLFFFIFSLCIMLIAHLVFSLLFIALYCGHTWTDKERAVVWLCMVPLAQCVPIFIWLHSFEFQWFHDMLIYFGLNTDQPGTGSIRDDEDPLLVWIKKKFASHGGFIMEACVEAFPQSILQMVSIVIYHEHTTLNIVSVIISMTAVASKSVMLAYNIDRRVFLFNFACFVGDIFNVFATVAWVFHSKEKTAYVETTLAKIWAYKVMLLALFILGFGIIQLRRWIHEHHGRCCHPWSRWCKGFAHFFRGLCTCIRNCQSCQNGTDGCWTKCVTTDPDRIQVKCFCNCGYQVHQNPCWRYNFKRMFRNGFDWLVLVGEFLVMWPLAVALFLLMGTGVYIFAIMAGEIFKLGFFWLMIFGLGQDHRSAPPFYRYLFTFLQTSRNTKDCKLRLALTNQNLLQRHFAEHPRTELRDPDSLELRHKQEKFCRQDPTSVTFTEMHGFNSGNDGMTCGECLRLLFIEGCKKNFWRWVQCECFDSLEQCYFITTLAPFDLLSALFTILFPILSLCITPPRHWTVLQETLTFIYIGVLFIILALSVYVYKFFRLSSSVFAPMHTKTTVVVDQIIAYWKDFIATEIRNQIVRSYFPDVHYIILDLSGRHRVHDTNWIPPIDWKNAGKMEGRYTDWCEADRHPKKSEELCTEPCVEPVENMEDLDLKLENLPSLIVFVDEEKKDEANETQVHSRGVEVVGPDEKQV